MCTCLAELREKIENAPVELDFFGPYISRGRLMEFLDDSEKHVNGFTEKPVMTSISGISDCYAQNTHHKGEGE